MLPRGHDINGEWYVSRILKTVPVSAVVIKKVNMTKSNLPSKKDLKNWDSWFKIKSSS